MALAGWQQRNARMATLFGQEGGSRHAAVLVVWQTSWWQQQEGGRRAQKIINSGSGGHAAALAVRGGRWACCGVGGMAVRDDRGGGCAIALLGWQRGYGGAGGGVDAVTMAVAILLWGERAVEDATRVGGGQ
jgi:hypothetical protein